MELKIFRDTMPQAGTVCTVKAELPLETEILVSDYLPPVFKLVKCFAKPVILQKQLQPGRLTLEGYLRCTVYYQGEEGTGLCQTEQKLPFTKQLELPEFDGGGGGADRIPQQPGGQPAPHGGAGCRGAGGDRAHPEQSGGDHCTGRWRH